MSEEYEIKPARYAKNMMAVHVRPDPHGFKSRAGHLAEVLGGRYSHREKAYIMSASKTEKFKKYHSEGWNASAITRKLTPPKVNEEGEGGAPTNSVSAGGVAGITGEPPVHPNCKPNHLRRKAAIIKKVIKEWTSSQ